MITTELKIRLYTISTSPSHKFAPWIDRDSPQASGQSPVETSLPHPALAANIFETSFTLRRHHNHLAHDTVVVATPGIMAAKMDNYASKTAIGLGIVHILIGVISMVFTGLFYHSGSFNNVSNGWGWGIGSLLFMASGSVAIAGGCKKTKSLIIATLIFSIISAIAAFSLLVLSSVFVNLLALAPAQLKVPYYIGIVLVLIMLIVATVSATLAGKVVFRKDQPK